MLKSFFFFLLALFFTVPLAADQVTSKFDWQPIHGIQEVHAEAGRIVISQIEFDLGGTLEATPVRRSSAKAVVRVDNNGWSDQEVGIAVVVFDADGNVVATGSGGTKWGYLNKGDRAYYTVSFPYMYRNFERAKTFLLTLETKSKGRDRKKSGKPAPAPGPTPASPSS
ncbi:MAG TPA: hypothetical protein VLO07_01660 [Thermoanaerobaculia bacterium]|nr:hypothetical protein [Thermoanaerobaculia bacterium]